MRRLTAIFFVGLFAAVLLGGQHAWASVAKVFDGKSFVGELGKKDQVKGDKDEWIFQEGKLRSTACDPYGFSPGAYRITQVTPQGEEEFEAVCTSPTDGKMTWKGTVQGDQIEGTALWEKSGQAPVEHWFKGTFKKK